MWGKIDKEIIRLAIPNIISNVSIPLLSTVDTLLMGNLSIQHLATIGIGSMIFNMIYWNFGFLRMGTTGLTAQAFGAKDYIRSATILGKAFFLALVLASLLLVLSNLILEVSLYLFNVTESAEQYVIQYFNIRIWAAPATLVTYVLFGWLFGLQNPYYPLVVTIGVNLVNIFVSYIGVVVLGYGIYGVAWGTVVAQYFGVIMLVGIIGYRYKVYLTKIALDKVFRVMELFEFLRINLDIFIRTACLTFAFSFFYSQSFKLGTIILAANVILLQFINWMSYGIDGFAYATESIVGKYKGANDKILQLQTTLRSFAWGGIVALIYSIVYYIFGEQLVSIFSNEENALAVAKDLLIYVWIFPLIAFASYIWDGVFVGLVASKSMRNAMALSLILFLAAYYLLPQQDNGSHIWQSLCLFMIARGVIQSMYFKKFGFQLK